MIYFSREQYYSKGKHPGSSASRDIIYELYDELAPTVFANLSPMEHEVIEEILSIEETYRAQARLVRAKRDEKDFDNVEADLAKISVTKTFTVPEGPVVSVLPYLEDQGSFDYLIATQLLETPINMENLLAQKEQLINECAESLADIIASAREYLSLNLEIDYFKWLFQEHTATRDKEKNS